MWKEAESGVSCAARRNACSFQKGRVDCLLESSEGAWFFGHLHFWLLASGTIKNKFWLLSATSVVILYLVWKLLESSHTGQELGYYWHPGKASWSLISPHRPGPPLCYLDSCLSFLVAVAKCLRRSNFREEKVTLVFISWGYSASWRQEDWVWLQCSHHSQEAESS